MAKRPKLDHLKTVRSGGKVYYYFNTGQKKASGALIYAKLPDMAHEGFWPRYAALKASRSKREQVGLTIAKLADDYERSQHFKLKAEGTRRLYGLTLKRIVDELGEFPVADLERSDIRQILEAMTDRPGAHNIFLAVLGVIYDWCEQTDKQPTKGFAKLAIGEHEPWPEDILEAGLTADHERTRLAVNLLYFTGQRIGDVCAMRWSDIRGETIYLTQQKRKKRVAVRVHAELADVLAQTPRRGLTIITNHKGDPMTPQVIRRELKAFTDGLGVQTVPHGLRKNAVNALLEAGCTVAEVAAVTGQTFKVVEKYAARVNNKTLAASAMTRHENKRRTGKGSGKTVPEGAEILAIR